MSVYECACVRGKRGYAHIHTNVCVDVYVCECVKGHVMHTGVIVQCKGYIKLFCKIRTYSLQTCNLNYINNCITICKL